MKTIGLIGGLTWESTAEYYRMINEEVSRRLGGVHSARIIMYSFDFQDIDTPMMAGRWDEIGTQVAEAARRLEREGADLLLICSNTIHKVAESARSAVSIPLLHLVDVTAGAIRERGFGKVGLLGTIFTMEQEFYRGALKEKHGLDVLVPGKEDRIFINRVIDEELTFGEIKESSRSRFVSIIEDLSSQGAEGVILGCTEIPLLVRQKDTKIPVFDTTGLHSMAAVDWALEGPKK
jgi:aspartate racemase